MPDFSGAYPFTGKKCGRNATFSGAYPFTFSLVKSGTQLFRSIPVHFAAISGQKSPAIRHFSGAYPFNHADFQLSYVL